MAHTHHSKEFLNITDAARDNIEEITVKDLAINIENQDKFTLIDVREDCEWNAGHIVNATHLSKGLIECEIEKNVRNKNQALVLYCRGGFRSLLAADSLKKMGYANVKSMVGGFTAWVEAGFEYDGELMDAAKQADYYEKH